MTTITPKICCSPASEFGEVTIQKAMYCDIPTFTYYRCTVLGFPTEEVCVPTDPEVECSDPETPCDIDPEAQCCSYVSPARAGTTGYLIAGLPSLPFTENGPGTIIVQLRIDVSSCTEVVEGTGTVLPIAGDKIHALFTVDIGLVGCPDTTNAVEMEATPISMTQVGVNSFEAIATMGVGGVGTLTCGVDMALSFGASNANTCWPRNSCFASIAFSGFVRAEDSAGDPKDFAIEKEGDYGFSLTARLNADTGATCCGPHDIIYEDIDIL